MRETEDVLAAVCRRLDSDWPDPDQGTRWPLRVSLRAASRTDAEADFRTVHAWATRWQEWVSDRPASLVWTNRRVHGTTQPLPTHLVVANIDAAAALGGPPWPARIAQTRQRRALLADQFPHIEASPTVRAAVSLTDTDFSLLLAASAWFAVHDATGLTPRQVPIPGLHAKWLDTHHTLVSRLSGRADLNLAGRPGVVRYAHVDPDHLAAGGPRYGSVTAVTPDVDLPPAYRPDVVVIVENLDTMLAFPALPGGIVVCGWGSAATLIPRISWIRTAPRVVYWGDIDIDGYEILNRLRADGIAADSVLMGLATLTAYAAFASPTDLNGRPLGPGVRRDLTHLTATEAEAYLALTSPDRPGPWRLEQERIPLNVAIDALVGDRCAG